MGYSPLGMRAAAIMHVSELAVTPHGSLEDVADHAVTGRLDWRF